MLLNCNVIFFVKFETSELLTQWNFSPSWSLVLS